MSNFSRLPDDVPVFSSEMIAWENEIILIARTWEWMDGYTNIYQLCLRKEVLYQSNITLQALKAAVNSKGHPFPPIPY